MRNTFLKSKNVHLVLLEKADAPILTSGINDHNVTKFLSRGDTPMTAETEVSWVESLYKNDSQLVLGIWLPEKEILIGTLGLHAINRRDQHATLGIAIYDTKYHGNGYGAASVSLILEHGFNRMNLRNIDLSVLANNVRAIRCYEKCGFVEVGRYPSWFYKEGGWHDQVLMIAERK